MLRARFLLVLAAAASASAFLRSTDILNDRPTIVRRLAPNGLLPCTCDGATFNCTDRRLTHLGDGGRCAGATSLDISRNLLATFPDGISSPTKVIASQNLFTATPTLSQLNPAITYLDIAQNPVENATSYRSLSSLQELYVHQTKLGSLWFLPYPCALRILYASHAKLRILEANVLECHDLEELYLDENQIDSLSSGVFSNLTKLRKLILAQNPLTTLSPQLFTNLHQLQTLSLRSTNISELPPHIFDSLTQLRNLLLAGNSIRTLPPEIFSTLTHLSTLDLSANKIEMLPIEPFHHLQALEELNLFDNNVKAIPDGAFFSLVNLKELHLLQNPLQSFGINLFSNTTELEAVSLDGNLASLPRGILSHGTSLKYALLPRVVNSSDLHLLSHVDLVSISGWGEVHWHSRAYAALTHTKMLIINYYRVISMANDTFDGLANLQTLDIGHNDIIELPEKFFSYTPNIKVVTMYENKLTRIPENLFSGLLRIEEIFLTRNRLSEIPENVFQGLSTLERVDLSYNHLSSIPADLFSNLPAMNELNLDSNKLTTLPALDSRWPPFKKVSIEDNQVTQVPRDALVSWLGTGDQERYVILSEEEGRGARLQDLQWLSREPGVVIQRATVSDCRCWLVRRGAALLFLCMDALCPATAGPVGGTSWEDVMRANEPTPAPEV